MLIQKNKPTTKFIIKLASLLFVLFLTSLFLLVLINLLSKIVVKKSTEISENTKIKIC